jgi:hypothetical protein
MKDIYVFFSTKSEKKRVEHVLPGSGGGGGGRSGGGGLNNVYTCKLM